MMVVDKDKCIGCGLCVTDCFPKDIELVDGKARFNNVTCIKCGHCIAICPTNAVSIEEYDMNEVLDYDKEKFSIEPDTLLNFIKFRRSVRQFKQKQVEEEKIIKIIEAGRFTETGGNSQDVSYTVLRENLGEVRELTLKSLNDMGEHLLANMTPKTRVYRRYAKMWVQMYKDYCENPNSPDLIFFKAPAVIVISSNLPVNGALAASNMALMANALGLGTVFSGFFTKAVNDTKELRELAQIKRNKEVVACMMLGYPKVSYKRTVPRKLADICWK